jgi:hypothetical protein
MSPAYEFICSALKPALVEEMGGPLLSSNMIEGARIDQSGKMKALDKLLSFFSMRLDKVG